MDANVAARWMKHLVKVDGAVSLVTLIAVLFCGVGLTAAIYNEESALL